MAEELKVEDHHHNWNDNTGLIHWLEDPKATDHPSSSMALYIYTYIHTYDSLTCTADFFNGKTATKESVVCMTSSVSLMVVLPLYMTWPKRGM